MADAAAPKLDFKMLVLPAVMIFSKKIDFKDPVVVQYLQILFVTGTFLHVPLTCLSLNPRSINFM